MGATIGIILIVTALFVGISIMVTANNSVRDFKEEKYVLYTSKQGSSVK